jgi:general stress protein 26
MDKQEKLVELLRGFDTAMLVTHTPDDQIASRPMAIAEIQDNGEMWFVTDQNSGKMVDLSNDRHVGVALQKNNQFVSMSGKAQVSSDRNKIQQLWQESWRVWFPKGKDDSSLCLLHVLPTRAEYWDNSGTAGIKYLFKAGKAYLQGERPNLDETENASISMRH